MRSKQTAMSRLVIGVIAWIGVAILAVVAAANWDAFWGAFPVAAAVVVAWAVGEWVMRDETEGSAQ